MRIKGIQKRFPKPMNKSWRDVMYPARTVVVWNSLATGIIATVKLLVFTKPRKAKKQTVR
jgi:hypothetical protein